jgi:mono/diheme cytochrome c family protein
MIKQILADWKPKWYANRFKLTLLGIVVGAIVAPLLVLAIPYLELLNDMAVQPKGKAQGQYGWFSDVQLQVERPPVPGTVPVTYYSYPYPKDDEANTKFAEKHGREVASPLDVAAVEQRRAAMERGKEIWTRICQTCHGVKADGDGPIVGPDLFPAPPTLRSKGAKGYKDGHIYHVITRGQKKMPAYGDVLDPEERWAVILYVRALQKTSGGGQ